MRGRAHVADGLREERRVKADQRKREAAAQYEVTIRERDEADDKAARTAMATYPAGTARRLAGVVKKARACGSERAQAAVHRVRGVVHE